MTKEDIRKKCFIGLSEDKDGEFYPIYDFDKLYGMIVKKAHDFVDDNFDAWIGRSDLFSDEFTEYMLNDKKPYWLGCDGE